MRKYKESDVAALMDQGTSVQWRDLEVELKGIPGVTRPGELDDYEKACQEDNWVGQEKKRHREKPSDAIAAIRDSMGFPNYNLNRTELYTGYETILVEGRQVGIWRYYKRRTEKKIRPALVFIHGGGWIGGTVFAVENPCRLIAELADAVVFNIDYSLAPEHPYPAAFHDCYAAVCHISSHAAEYGIDPAAIAVAGDSAGGNLSAAVSMKARDDGKQLIAAQFLIYPAVTQYDLKAPGYQWTLDAYEIASGKEKEILPLLTLGTENNKEEDLFAGSYLPDRKMAEEPYVSPMMAKNHENLPRAVIMTAEFDGLRLQGEFYGWQLQQAGTPVRVIRYLGTSHAFIDRLGYVPAAEAACREIAAELSNIGKQTRKKG